MSRGKPTEQVRAVASGRAAVQPARRASQLVRRDDVGVGKGVSAPGREGMGGMAVEERDRAQDTDVRATGVSPSARFPGEADEFATDLIREHAGKGSSG